MTRSLCRLAPLAAILALGLGLRLAPWGQNRFMEDEALYSYWGLQIASASDPMLDHEPVDKPPLHPYTLALSLALLLPSVRQGQIELAPDLVPLAETAARLPSLLASATTIILVYMLTRAVWPVSATASNPGEPVRHRPHALREVGALLAALFFALSPFDILFASTAYTDPLMSGLVMAALLAAARDRLALAGLSVGLAAATKQQALFFVPLTVTVGLLAPRRSSTAGLEPALPASVGTSPLVAGWARFRCFIWRIWNQRWARFALLFLAIAGGALLWDCIRLQRPGFLPQSLISYGGLAPAGTHSLAARGLEWLHLVGTFWSSPFFNGLLLTVMAVATALALRRPRAVDLTRLDLALGLFALAFLLVHWLVGFQTWDRYLLGLVPIVAILAARTLVSLSAMVGSGLRRWVCIAVLSAALLASLARPVLQSTAGELPVGGDHGAYDGIDELAAYLRVTAPEGSVLYHTWLGYHYRFYLYGTPLRTHWYPDLEDLVADAVIYRREPRYIAFPSWRDGEPAARALGNAGISLVPLLETTRRDSTISFRLYQLEGP